MARRFVHLLSCASLVACLDPGARRGAVASLEFEAGALELGTGQVQIVSLVSGAAGNAPARVPVGLVVCLSSDGFPARLELFEPLPGLPRASTSWVRVAGRVASRELRSIDLLIAIDVSSSAFLPSGIDLDRDGIVGRAPEAGLRRSDGSLRHVRRWTTDPGDTVLEVSRSLARRIVDALSDHDVRVGLLTFAERMRVWARLGPAKRARRALDALRAPLVRGGTNLRDAILVAGGMLAPWPDDGRQKILVVISDGFATRPRRVLLAHRATRDAVERVARSGVAIYWVKVGGKPAEDPAMLADLETLTVGLAATGHGLRPLRADLPVAPASASLDRLEIENETTGDRGRALRLARDGSFDGLVRVAPGSNRVVIRARATSGGRYSATRTVYGSPRVDPGDLERLLDSLRARSLEIERARLRGRGERDKRLEIRAED